MASSYVLGLVSSTTQSHLTLSKWGQGGPRLGLVTDHKEPLGPRHSQASRSPGQPVCPPGDALLTATVMTACALYLPIPTLALCLARGKWDIWGAEENAWAFSQRPGD